MHRLPTPLKLFFFLLGAGNLAGAFTAFAGEISSPVVSPLPQRIISLAPSTTEILFALGVGDRVVGVTRYCDYPAAATPLAKVGGYVDPNYEAIVALQPDLVVMLTSHHEAKVYLEKMKLRTLVVPHDSLADVRQSIRLIGEACGAGPKAEALLAELAQRTATVKQAVEGKPRLRVLLCIGRDTKSGQLAGMYMAGRDGFYNGIIELAGGVNACNAQKATFPQLSAEGVLQLNPDVIVDLIGHINPGTRPPAEIKQQWEVLRTVNAVRQGQVHVLVGRQALRPGPRYIEFLEQLARLLHPEAFDHESVHE